MEYKTGTLAFFELFKKESIFALYKGSLSPIIGNCGTLSLIYGFDGMFKKLLLANTQYKDPLPYTILFVSSFLAS